MVFKQSCSAEFSRQVEVGRLGDGETVHEIEASAAERAALAKRFDLVALDRLQARVRLRRVRGGAAIRLTGDLVADVTQSCVVTLAPVANHIEERFTLTYAESPAAPDEVVFGPEAEEEWPEPLTGGLLDIGEAVAQQLSLALDPYPRAPGAEIDPRWRKDDGAPDSPFGRLSALGNGTRRSGKA